MHANPTHKTTPNFIQNLTEYIKIRKMKCLNIQLKINLEHTSNILAMTKFVIYLILKLKFS